MRRAIIFAPVPLSVSGLVLAVAGFPSLGVLIAACGAVSALLPMCYLLASLAGR